MYLILKNPDETLVKAGYVMDGESNSYRRHLSITTWFHAYVNHTKKDGITIHMDSVKEMKEIPKMKVKDLKTLFYSKHKTFQRNETLDEEIVRIKQSEPKSFLEHLIRL